jgi:hypothetical protein
MSDPSGSTPSTDELPGTALTGSYHSDIVFLSSWLSGRSSDASINDRSSTKNSNLALLTHLSTLLTIGNHNAPLANAVVGRVDATSVHCLVFAENVSFKKKDESDVQSDNFEIPLGRENPPSTFSAKRRV